MTDCGGAGQAAQSFHSRKKGGGELHFFVRSSLNFLSASDEHVYASTKPSGRLQCRPWPCLISFSILLLDFPNSVPSRQLHQRSGAAFHISQFRISENGAHALLTCDETCCRGSAGLSFPAVLVSLQSRDKSKKEA
jgi:hypothetical protein